MAIVSVPYNPWKENIAAQIGMMLWSKMLEQYQAAEAGRKFAAILQESGNWTGADEDARALNEVARQQIAESSADARLTQPFVTTGGVPVAVGSPSVAPGVPGGAPMAAGIPGGSPTLEQIGGGGFNVNEYDPRLAPYLSKAQQMGGVASRAPETPNFNLVKMMELLATPRFAAYSGPIMDQILKMQTLYGQRREGNWKDWKTLVEAMGASSQGQTLAAAATGNLPKNVDFVKLAAAQGTHIGPPHQAIWEQEKSRVMDADSQRDYALGLYASDNNLAGTRAHAQAMRDSAAIQANAQRDVANIYGPRTAGGSNFNATLGVAGNLARADFAEWMKGQGATATPEQAMQYMVDRLTHYMGAAEALAGGGTGAAPAGANPPSTGRYIADGPFAEEVLSPANLNRLASSGLTVEQIVDVYRGKGYTLTPPQIEVLSKALKQAKKK